MVGSIIQPQPNRIDADRFGLRYLLWLEDSVRVSAPLLRSGAGGYRISVRFMPTPIGDGSVC